MDEAIARIRQDGAVQSLADHLRGVAETARGFAARTSWRNWAYTAGLLHDIGKHSKEFQGYIRRVTTLPERERGRHHGPDHSTAGAKLANRRFKDDYIGWLLAYPIAGHHAGLPNGRSGSLSHVSDLENRLEKSIPDYSLFPEELLDTPQLNLENDIPFDLNSKEVNPYYSFYFFIKFLYSCLVDADFLDTERFMKPETYKGRGKYPGLEELAVRFEQEIKKRFGGKGKEKPLNLERTKIREQCLKAAEEPVGLFSLTVPTGGGKTLSSMAFALRHARKHDLKRIIYVIPYTSIIEQNADVFREHLGAEAVLEHHSNFDPEDAKKKELINDIEQWKRATENWDAPLVVTTNVQFFESLFHHRSSRNRKLHNMMDSVVILDEAQMIPPEHLLPCLEVLRILATQYNTSVVLCTATQPALSKRGGFEQGLAGVREIMDNPTELFQKEVFRRVKIEVLKEELTVDELAERMKEEEQVLNVVNTRRQAREIFAALGDNEGNFHLSALMCPAHRSVVIEKEIKERLKNDLPCRVVSTQLIEAGVDIDFPVVYRAETGIDSIAQAAGRCNREGQLTQNGQRVPGRVVVFHLDEEKKRKGPSFLRQRVQAAKSVIRHYRDDLLAPEPVEEYFKELFWVKGEDGLDKLKIGKSLREGGIKRFPFRYIGEKFRFIDSPTLSVIIPWGAEGDALVEKLRYYDGDFKLPRKAQRFTVQVYEWHYRKLYEAGALETLHDRFYVLLTLDGLYDEKLGLVSDPDGIYDPKNTIV
ncbi:CRISPR-associated helicase Cas3' [bacterium]|nr:CRISPR-associated helicase Cas3' [bacterium]